MVKLLNHMFLKLFIVIQKLHLYGDLNPDHIFSKPYSLIMPPQHNTFLERSHGMFGRFHWNVQGTFLELRKCPRFLNVPKQCSLNVSVERSKGILGEPTTGIFKEFSQRTFLEPSIGSFTEHFQRTFVELFAGIFREPFLGMFLELFATAFRKLALQIILQLQTY